MKSLHVAFLMNPLEGWDTGDDTSLSIMTECRRRGHRVSFFESHEVFVTARAVSAELRVGAPHPLKGFETASRRVVNLASLDAIVVRKEPPVHSEYLACMDALSRIEKKTFILNRPSGIRAVNEKLSVLEFPKWAPKTALVYTASAARAQMSALRLGDAVLKRIDLKGGAGIERTSPSDPELDRKIKELTADGMPVIVQEFIPHEKSGDKRILILGGRAIGAFERVPGPKDFRANMALGGSARASKLTKRDLLLARALAPYLRKHGIHFAGVDVLDGRLSEINVTSPAGIPEINRFDGVRLERIFVDYLERQSGK